MFSFSKSFLVVSTTLFTLIAFNMSNVAAAQVSQAQIAQFQKLPKAQQAMLAKTMGIDLNAIQSQLNSTTSSHTQTEEIEQAQPRQSISDKNDEEDEFEQLSTLKPFGYDVFANTPDTFAPTMDIAIPENYIIAPGDKISVQVFGKESLELTLEVNRQGQVIFPSYGPFSVAGLTFDDMKRLLVAKIKEKVMGVDAVVSMASLRTMRVFVLGDVHQPGPYNLSSLSSITHALFAAGGISDIGSLRNIQLKRAGKLITQLDLYDLLIEGDSRNDNLLHSGDVVFVAPVGNTISIEGEVRRPAIYELTNGDNFANVVAMSGGLLPSAYANAAIVERHNQNNLKSVLNLNFTNKQQLLKKAHAGDVIKVMKSADIFEDSVTIIGAITRPGKYQWQLGQKIADLLPTINSHLLTDADLSYSLVVREIDLERNIQILQFELSKAIGDPTSLDNLTLQANDKVVIFSNHSILSEGDLSLDMMAFTEAELFKQERQLAKEEYKTKQFWQKYGRLDKVEEVADDASVLVNESIMHMTGGSLEKEVDVKDLTIFSRQRLLLPIIQKLKRQGKTGKPIQLIEIDGEVKFPGVYPLALNARVDDLVIAAGGLNESAYLARAELTRNRVEDSVNIQTVNKRSISINLASALDSQTVHNVLLHSKDRLNIHQIPAWSENHVIELRGEFVFPGKYTIRRGESLSDLISKAGGFTQFAHPEGSVFTRIKLQELEQQNLLKLASDLRVEIASKSLSDESFNQSYSEIQSLLSDLTKLQPVGRLVLDLPNVVENNSYDVLLEDGDVLYVPTHKNSVNVIGQVQVTSSHIYDENLTARDYLANSGGVKKRADAERIYIISANGRIKMMENDNWFASERGSNMQPGDTVVVPLDSEYMNNLTLWTNATTIMYNTAVAIAAISGI